MEKIAIIGAGKVGSTLGERLRAARYEVHIGARRPETSQRDLGAVTPADAVRQATMVLVTVPAAAAVEALAGLSLPAGAIIVDCTNPMRWDNGPIWNPPAEGSTTAAIAKAHPGSAVVKAFNHFGVEVHANPGVAGGPADAFVAGDDAAAKRRVMDVANHLGYRAIDAGLLRNAAVLENLTVLWIQLATTGLTREFAFRAVGR